MTGEAWVIDGRLVEINLGTSHVLFPEIEYEILEAEPDHGVSDARYVRDRTGRDWMVGWVMVSSGSTLAVAWPGQGCNHNARKNGG